MGRKKMVCRGYAYQELAGHQDDDTAGLVGGLGIDSRDLVLDLLEGEALSRKQRQQVVLENREASV